MKNILLLSLLIFGFMLFTQPASATVTVRGSASCGTWVDYKSNNSDFYYGAKMWLLGYLSALALESNKDILATTDNQSIFLWVDNYCNQNPLKDVSDAGEILFLELKRSVKKR